MSGKRTRRVLDTDAVTGAVCAYCRVSRPEQAAADKTSIADQEKRIRAALTVKGWDEVELVVFQDKGISGSVALQDRPEGKILWDALSDGDTLIAAKLDRLFRSAEDALRTSRELQERGVRLILLDIGIDAVTDDGPAKLFFTLLSAVAEFERWRTAERTRDGKRGKRAKMGHAGGSAPYGFSVEGKGREARLIPIESEQGIIVEAKRLRETGISLLKVSAALEEQGLRNRLDKPFTGVQIQRMTREHG
jgi:putative DNA-invertase from lambdoid prophage Rac